MDGRTEDDSDTQLVLMAVAVVVAIGGLIYDGLRDGKDPNCLGCTSRLLPAA